MKYLLPFVTAVVVAVAVVAIYANVDRDEPGEKVEIVEASFPDMTSSIDQLTAMADSIVIGAVSGVVDRGVDRGADGQGIPVAYTLYGVDVVETLKGSPAERMYVFRIDPSEFPDEPLTELAVGERVALYLYEGPAHLAPTIAGITGVAYVPIALDNGVFDVDAAGAVGRVDDGVVVRPRGISPVMFSEGTTFTVSELRAAVEPVDEVGPVGNTN